MKQALHNTRFTCDNCGLILNMMGIAGEYPNGWTFAHAERSCGSLKYWVTEDFCINCQDVTIRLTQTHHRAQLTDAQRAKLKL